MAHVIEINLSDPTSYQEIFRGLRGHLHKVIEGFSPGRFFIAVASGTPQMHACWVPLAASGEIPARILHVRPPRFVTRERPLVTEVDLSSLEMYVGSGRSRQFVDAVEWEKRFREAWNPGLSAGGLKAKIFIWDDHHDRYLITDLIGIEMGNGYDTTANPNDITTWSRIGRKDRDDIQREFDPACNRHTLRYRFTVP